MSVLLSVCRSDRGRPAAYLVMGTPGVSVLPSKLNTWSSFCTMHWTSNVLLSLLQAAP